MSDATWNRMLLFADAHWGEMQNHAGQGLPMTLRAKALRANGQYLTRKMVGGEVFDKAQRPMVAPFANAVGRTRIALRGDVADV